MKNILKWLTMVGLLLNLSVCIASSGDYQKQLAFAESIKSSNTKEFSRILSELTPEFDNLDINQKYRFIYLKGYLSALTGKFLDAEKNYLHVFNNSRDVNLKYQTALSLVNLKAFQREWEKGLLYIQFIEQNKDLILDLDIKHQGLIAIAIFFDEIEYHKVTIQYLMDVLRESSSERNLCLAKTMTLKSQRIMGENLDFPKEFSSTINICENANEPLLANVVRAHLARFYVNKGNGQEAINIINPVLSSIEKSNYQILIIEIHGILARANWLMNDLGQAKIYANLAIEKQNIATHLKPIADSFNILYEISLKQERLSEAIEYLKAYFDAEKKHFEEINGRQLAIESAKRQSAEKDVQISALNKENKILQLEKELSQESANYNRWIIILLLFSVSVLTMWIIYVYRSQRQLKYLAEYDSLTGICNRAFFTQKSESALNYFSKTNQIASLVLFDLDFFKKINDTYGHPIGDEVLKLVAQACQESVRKVDILGRVGGEEFAIMLPGCENEQAHKIAEACRQKVSEIDTSSFGQTFSVTASFGIADTYTCGYLYKDLVAHADEAMYLAKRRGRNRIVIHKGENEPVSTLI